MTRKATSVKGESVDFDLIETKQKLEQNKPRVMEVKQREDFVHRRRKSRGRRSVMEKVKESKGGSKDKDTVKSETKKTETMQDKTPKTKETPTSNTGEKKKRTIVKKGTSKTQKDDE